MHNFYNIKKVFICKKKYIYYNNKKKSFKKKNEIFKQ